MESLREIDSATRLPTMKAKEFFSHPWFIAIASVCSILSVIEGVIIYRLQWAAPSIMASMNSVSTPVVKSGAASKLTVSYEGKPITSDITAVQIAIWNAGKKAVRPEQVLTPVTISTEGKRRILEAQIQRSTREVCKPTLLTDHLEDGKLGVDWRILEPNDGLLIQIIFEGPEKTQLSLQSTIEEQGEISGAITRRLPDQGSPIKVILAAVAFGVVAIGAAYSGIQSFKKESPKTFDKLFNGLYAVVMPGLCLSLVWLFWYGYVSRSPFGF